MGFFNCGYEMFVGLIDEISIALDLWFCGFGVQKKRKFFSFFLKILKLAF